MLHEFDDWSAKQAERHTFSSLKDAVVAIEVDSYLAHILNQKPYHEPLLAAHGGLPFGFKHYVEQDLDKLKSDSITPFFCLPWARSRQEPQTFLIYRCFCSIPQQGMGTLCTTQS